MNSYEKRFIATRYWLLGHGFHLALKALEFAKELHTGTRKDGFTPEFDHQISIAGYIRTLPQLMYPEETLAATFLHDVCEDYDISNSEITEKFGGSMKNTLNLQVVGDIPTAVSLLSKKIKSKEPAYLKFYYEEQIENPIASIVKGADRIHNQQSMIGVFTYEKQKSYITETNDFILPMLKAARRFHPEQEPAYENIKHVLRSQIQLIQAIHDALPVAST